MRHASDLPTSLLFYNARKKPNGKEKKEKKTTNAKARSISKLKYT